MSRSNEVFLSTDPLLLNNGSTMPMAFTDPFDLGQEIGTFTNNVLQAPVGAPSADLLTINAGNSYSPELGLLSTSVGQANFSDPTSFAGDLFREQNLGKTSTSSRDFLTGVTKDGSLVGFLTEEPLISGTTNGTTEGKSLATKQVLNSSTLFRTSSSVSDAELSNITQSVVDQYTSTRGAFDETADRHNDDQLTSETLEFFRQEAISHWASLGITQTDLSSLSNVKLQLGDLAGSTLGLTSGQVITIDLDAAGTGWFIDPSPDDDKEFSNIASVGEVGAKESDSPFGHVNLLTVIGHEMGHVLGLHHVDSSNQLDHLMSATLSTGIRRPGCLTHLCETTAN